MVQHATAEVLECRECQGREGVVSGSRSYEVRHGPIGSNFLSIPAACPSNRLEVPWVFREKGTSNDFIDMTTLGGRVKHTQLAAAAEIFRMVTSEKVKRHQVRMGELSLPKRLQSFSYTN